MTTYRIYQNDLTRESFFWHDTQQRWVQLYGPYDAVKAFHECLRERPEGYEKLLQLMAK